MQELRIVTWIKIEQRITCGGQMVRQEATLTISLKWLRNGRMAFGRRLIYVFDPDRAAYDMENFRKELKSGQHLSADNHDVDGYVYWDKHEPYETIIDDAANVFSWFPRVDIAGDLGEGQKQLPTPDPAVE